MPRPGRTSQAVTAFLKMARRYDYEGPLTMRTFRRVDKVGDDEGPTFVADWIHEYMENIYAHDAARKIQKTFRLWRHKRMWRLVLEHRIWTRKYIMRRVLLGWMGVSTDNHQLMMECFDKFVALFHQRPWISLRQTIAPVGLWYLSGRYFYPRVCDANRFYGICRVVAYPIGRRVMMLWRNIAHSKRCMRVANRRVLFTIAKRKCFGPVFHAFVMWNRLTKWKKMTSDGRGSCELHCGENIINWNIIERRKNKQRELEVRAAKHSLERIRKKAYHAVYQRYLDGKQSGNDFAASIQFYHRHVMERCKQAWLAFMVLERKRRVYLSKMMKAWYQIAYRNVKVRRIRTVLERTHNVARLCNLFSAWRTETRNQKLLDVAHSLRLQKRRSILYFVFFVAWKMDDEIGLCRVFREWLTFTRRRRTWRLFIKYSHDVESEVEFKQCVFYALRRAADHKMIRKFALQENRFFPYQLPYSFDSMVNWLTTSRQKMKTSSSEQWKFITEGNGSHLDENLLCRALVLALHKHYKFLHTIVSVGDNSIEEDSKVYELDELSRAMEANRVILRRTFRAKVMRDASLLSMLDSHSSAIQFEKVHPMFTISSGEADLYGYPSSGDMQPLPLVLFGNLDKTVNDFIAENNASWKIDTRAWKGMRSAVDDFVNSFRIPSEVPELEFVAPTETGDPNQNTKAEEVIPSEVVEYRPPELTRMDSFPVKDPVISEVKSLQTSYNMQDKGLASLLKEKPPPHFDAFTTSTRLRSFSPEEILQSLRRFFLNMTGNKFDFNNIMPYGPQILDMFPQSRRHALRRRINTFLLELDDRDDETTVSVSVSGSPDAQGVVCAAVTAFREIKQNFITGEYCDQVPFSKDLHLGASDLVSVQEFIRKMAYSKFPRIAREARRTLTSSRAARRKSMMRETDELTNDDVMVTASLLPYIMNPDIISEFLRTEVVVDRRLAKKKDRPSLANDSSAFFDVDSSKASFGLMSDSGVFGVPSDSIVFSFFEGSMS